MKPVLVIDGDNVFRRFWYANPQSALSSWKRLLSDYASRINVPTCQVGVVFDGEDTRELPIAGYKANRSEMPEELAAALLEAETAAKFYADVIKIDGPEGDQVIYGVVKWASSEGRDSYVLSSDKDMLQLVRESPTKVTIVRPLPSGYVHFDSMAVRKHFDLRPDQIPSYLTIVGDTADNLKGIAGIGPKGAVDLLHRFGTIANLLENLASVPLKHKVLIESSMDLIAPTYQMVKLRYEAVPLREKSVSKKLGFFS